MTYAVSFMPTARGGYRLPIADCLTRSSQIYRFFSWGGDMPNFVYLNVKCAQYVNMEIFKEQALSHVCSSSSPCQLHADHVQMPVSHVPPFAVRISVRRWGDLLIFYLILNTYIKRNQFYCARFACLSNRIQFDLLFDLWSSKKARHRIYIYVYA